MEYCRVTQHGPQNGLAGLRHWRQDLVAGLIVALVSVPLSLGIALASGAPPICGLTSEIIAGILFPFLGGAYVTVSGPAAGLAPILYSSIAVLGKGDMEVGYRLVLGVIMFAGLTQLVLTRLKAARFSYMIPRAAVQGMLAAIGLLILVKQIPYFIGHKYHAHEFFGLIAETPSHLMHANPAVLLISVVCLALLFTLPKANVRLLRRFPPHLAVVVVSITLAWAFTLDSRFLVKIPENPLQHGLVMPDFQALFSDFKLIPTIVLSVVALTLVDGTESLATIHAVDQIDPYKRKSDPHRTLFAMGVSNICSSMIGGLTIIPGIIKSTTCIVAGGRTAWVNFYNAAFLLVFLLCANDLIRMIPTAALSAVLVHIGYKLAGPQQWQKMIDLGTEQLLVFSTTVLVTVGSDLLIGIAAGILVKIVILLSYSLKTSPDRARNYNRFKSLKSSTARLFANPLVRVEHGERETRLYFSGPLTCFNSAFVREAVETALHKSPNLAIILMPETRLVDHTSATYLHQLMESSAELGLTVTLKGLEGLSQCSSHSNALRYRAQW